VELTLAIGARVPPDVIEPFPTFGEAAFPDSAG